MLIALSIVIISTIVYYSYKYWDVIGYLMVEAWSELLVPITQRQDPINSELPSSMSLNENMHHSVAVELHHSINAEHDQILREVLGLLRQGYLGMSTRDLDSVQNSWLGSEDRWKVIWLRFYGAYSGLADRLPTLKKIVSKHLDDIQLLHVSILYPNSRLSLHHGVHNLALRYHYGLLVPTGDVGIRIAGRVYQWKNRESCLWNDFLPHEAWNFTKSPRIIIFADLQRRLPSPLNLISNCIYSLAIRTAHVERIRQRIQAEGKSFS